MKALLSFALLFIACLAHAQTFTNATGGSIPAQGIEKCFPATVSGVGNINGAFGLATVCLNITHAYDGDLQLSLKAPDGTTVLLSVANGSGGDNYTNTCFSMTAATPITSGTAPFNGTYRPQGDLGDVNNGQNANGVWSLCVLDNAVPDSGLLNSFSITFSNAPAPPAAMAPDEPCNALLLAVNAACNYTFFTNTGATASPGVPSPNCASYLDGDVWFKVVAPATGAFNINTKDKTITDGGMAIYKGPCSALTLISCDDNSSSNGNMPFISASGLTAGDTLRIRMWGRGVNNHGTFGICLSKPPLPTTQDCPGAIPICQSVYFITAAYIGTGNILNEINEMSSCLQSGEKNDVWYTFTTQTAGEVSFKISPNIPNEDYDWAVYNVTNATCADIHSNPALEVSCNYSATGGETGPTGGSTLTSQTAGGTPFNAKIPVTAGQTYVINVSNFSSSQNGYTLDFSASTAVIVDTLRPFVDTVVVDTCGSSHATLTFSENILCSTIQSADFAVTGPGGAYTISGLASPSCASGAAYGKTVTIATSPAMTAPGNYQLCITSASGSVSDACGNTALAACVPFTVNCPPLLYFRTRQSGNWHDNTTWETSPVINFSSGVVSPAQTFPSAENAISALVTKDHIVTVSRNGTSKSIRVNSELIINSGISLLVKPN